MSGERSFSEVTALVRTGADSFTGDLDPGWTVGDKPNGGYLQAVLGRAAATVAAPRQPLAVSAHFLRPPVPGTVDIEVEHLRSARSVTHLRTRMLQEGQACAEAFFALGALDLEGPTRSGPALLPRSDAASFDESVRLAPDPGVFRVALLDQLEVRMDPATLGWARGRPTGRGLLEGWLALPGGEPFDPLSLLVAVDAFPPATFDLEVTGWVPTVQLSTYLRALPSPGPVRIRHQANLVAGTRVDETCLVWDGEGTLVAQSTQLAGIRLTGQ